jgi:4-amino-4-deoxychorismate lyase
LKFYYSDNRQQQASPQPADLSQDRGYLFGDGFFTTGLIRNGELNHHQLHYQRLQQSAQRLSFASFNLDKLKQALADYIREVKQAAIRITVSRQQETRGYAFKPDDAVNILIQLSPSPELPKQSCHLIFSPTAISYNPSLAGIKHLNRLDSVLASQAITSSNQEVLLCHGDDIICGSRSNLFVYHQDEWLTPCLKQAGVAGITRQRLIGALGKSHTSVREIKITKNMLLNSEAALMTNSLWGIWPVSKVEDKMLATQASENLKLKLKFKP